MFAITFGSLFFQEVQSDGSHLFSPRQSDAMTFATRQGEKRNRENGGEGPLRIPSAARASRAAARRAGSAGRAE